MNGSDGVAPDLRTVVPRFIAQEFAERASQRSVLLWSHILQALCHTPDDVRTVVAAVEERLRRDVRLRPAALLTDWYVLDSALKVFRHQPKMVAALAAELPRLLQEYVPWNCSNPHEGLAKYRQMFGTWRNVMPSELNAKVEDMVRVALLD